MEITSKRRYCNRKYKKHHKALSGELIPKIIQGWQGRTKGMLQVLWECGFIDKLS
jgi:hypothetical protein